MKVLQKRKIPFIFFKRKNCKKYACPYVNNKIAQKYFDTYKIKVKDISKIDDYPGITICIDGDIYGSKSLCFKQTALLNIDKKKHIIFSLPENSNYLWVYDKMIQNVDYAIFPNLKYQYNFVNPKNLFIGTPKFDFPLNRDEILKKYGLDSELDSGEVKSKYAIIFYPEYRIPIAEKKFPNFMKFYDNIYKWLRSMGYKIIVKDRKTK